MAKLLSDVPIVDLKDYDIAEKKIHYIQINDVIDKAETRSAEDKKDLKKAKFNFMIDLKALKHKTSVDLKLLQLKVCVRNKQKDRAPEKYSPVFSKFVVQFDLLFAGDGIAIPHELKRPVVDALHFGHPGSTKMPAENSIFRWSG